VKLPLGKLHIGEDAPWEIVAWEVALGKMLFGKYLTPTKTGQDGSLSKVHYLAIFKKLMNLVTPIFQL